MITDVGLAMGGVAHKPWKLTAAEDYLIGKEPTTKNFEEAAQLALADARTLEHNAYKVPMGIKAIVRTLEQAYSKEA